MLIVLWADEAQDGFLQRYGPSLATDVEALSASTNWPPAVVQRTLG